MISRAVLLVAQGFGLGRVGLAPGTWGSLLGVLWFLLLASTRSLSVFAAGAVAGVFLSIWICGMAERLLKSTDPPSVVLDEVVAVPICYAGWVASLYCDTGGMPSPAYFFRGAAAWGSAGLFAAFRFFDIAKPWPVRASQRLPGGWGVTLDDVMAACYVNVAAAALRLFAA